MNMTTEMIPPAGRILVNRLLAMTLAILVVTTSSVARADMRKAARQAVAATVAVEWQMPVAAQEGKSPELDGVGGAPTGAQPNPYRSSWNAYMQDFARSSQDSEGSRLSSVVSASATVVSPDGLLVTHLDTGQDPDIQITFADGRTQPAKLLVDDRRSGLKLLKVNVEDLVHLELADSDVELGQPVLTAACTGLQSREVSQGIVASNKRSIPNLPCTMVQTDALVGVMSAGGPVVDAKGRLVGIVVAKEGRDAYQRGPAIAIPARWVRDLLEARKGEQHVVIQQGLLGVTLEESPRKEGSPLVTNVFPDQPADKAGVRVGDEILVIDGTRVLSPDDVVREIGRRQAGDTVTITLRRDGEHQDIQVALSVRETPPSTAQVRPSPRIQYVHPNRFIYRDEDGKLRVMTPKPGQANSKQAAEALRAWKQAADAWKEYSDATKGKDVAKFYGDAAKYFEKALQAQQTTAPTIRVERSEVDKKLDELGSEIRSLKAELKNLNEALKKLNQRLSQADRSK
jgi:S1-C subfamily serine protease